MEESFEDAGPVSYGLPMREKRRWVFGGNSWVLIEG